MHHAGLPEQKISDNLSIIPLHILKYSHSNQLLSKVGWLGSNGALNTNLKNKQTNSSMNCYRRHVAIAGAVHTSIFPGSNSTLNPKQSMVGTKKSTYNVGKSRNSTLNEISKLNTINSTILFRRKLHDLVTFFSFPFFKGK